jgi:hypothetical protein
MSGAPQYALVIDGVIPRPSQGQEPGQTTSMVEGGLGAMW